MGSTDYEFYLDVPHILSMANAFNKMSQVLVTVDKAMYVASMVLRTTAFVGIVGEEAVENYLLSIRPMIKKMADECREISTDLKSSIQEAMNGDRSGGGRFLS